MSVNFHDPNQITDQEVLLSLGVVVVVMIVVDPETFLGHVNAAHSERRMSGGAEAWRAVEADCFFCFTNLMAECRDHFCSKLDHTAVGITARIGRLEALLMAKDPPLGQMLARLKVSPSFYGFRWITLLMTQEWDLPDVLG